MDTSTTPVRPPLTLTVMALVAMTGLFFTSQSFLVLALIVAILPAHVSTWRWPRNSSTPWIVRLAAFGLIALMGSQRGFGAELLFDARTFNTLGLICAAEITIQLWREPPPGARYHPSIILLSGVILLAACNTYRPDFTYLCVPVFMICAMLAPRDWRPRIMGRGQRGVGENYGVKNSGLALTFGHALAMIVALGLGGLFHFYVQTNRNELMALGVQLLRDRAIAQSAGLSTQPSLDSTFETPDSPQRVLRIRGDAGEEHWRAMAFDTYGGGRWAPTIDVRKLETLSEVRQNRDAAGKRVHVTQLVGNNSGIVFAPLHIAAIIPGEGSDFDWDASNGGPLQTQDPAPYSYEIVPGAKYLEGIPIQQGTLCDPLTDEMRERCLQIPPNLDPRVREITERITAKDWHPAQRAMSITQFLMSNNAYSRRTRRGGGDPVSSFILERKSAHCEYFASAAVIMMRCAGVPARYVTGYYAHEVDSSGDTIVRQRDAHAWAEAWIDGVGWVTVEATPASGRPDEAAPPLPFWQRSWEWIQDRFMQLRMWMSQLTRWQLFGILMAIVAIWMLERWRLERKRRKARATGSLYAPPHADLVALGARFERVLERQGVECHENRPWIECLAARKSAGSGDQEERERKAALIFDPTSYLLERQFIDTYNAVRFGQQDSVAALHELERTLRELESKKTPEPEKELIAAGREP